METVLITGGSGTIGKAFIREFYEEFKFISYARNEKAQVLLKRNFPDIEIVLGSVEDNLNLENTFEKYKPSIVIHAAALKHVDTAEKQPSMAIGANITGSLNVIKLSKKYNISACIGISTDKACNPENLYGQTKYLMERMFQEFDNPGSTRFVNCRFGNVAWSNGSVLPYWTRLANEGKSLPITDINMTRLIFSDVEAAQLIRKCLSYAKSMPGYFILSKNMKKVSMLKLAKLISKDVHVIGLREGEILHEDLINEEESKFTYKTDDDYLMISPVFTDKKLEKFNKTLSSDNAEEMSSQEMLDLLQIISKHSTENGKLNY